jgi:hypothetical protein
MQNLSSAPKASRCDYGSVVAVTSSSSRLRGPRNVEYFILIWLDLNVDENGSEIGQLRRIINEVRTFVEPDECFSFLTSIGDDNDDKIFLIISDHVGEHFVSTVHSFSHIDSIYVFCTNKHHHERWAKTIGKSKVSSQKLSNSAIVYE